MTVLEYRKAKTTYFDVEYDQTGIKLLPCEYYVSTQREMLATVLGSCISVCLFDPVLKIGGMNHYMLPGTPGDQEPIATRYAEPALSGLLEDVVAKGASLSRITAKMFGGAQGFESMSTLRVGQQNIEYARSFLKRHQIDCIAEDVGGTCARRIVFFTESGDVRLRRLSRRPN